MGWEKTRKGYCYVYTSSILPEFELCCGLLAHLKRGSAVGGHKCPWQTLLAQIMNRSECSVTLFRPAEGLGVILYLFCPLLSSHGKPVSISIICLMNSTFWMLHDDLDGSLVYGCVCFQSFKLAFWFSFLCGLIHSFSIIYFLTSTWFHTNKRWIETLSTTGPACTVMQIPLLW